MKICKNCGFEFEEKYCPKCGTEFIDEKAVDSSEVSLSSYTDEDREAEIRRKLWSSMHSHCIDTTECIRLAKELEEYKPNDYYANFAETVLNGDDKAVSNFLDNFAGSGVEMYAESVLDYVCARMNFHLYSSAYNFVNRSNLKDSSKYIDVIERYAPKKMVRGRKREASVSVDADVWLHYKKLLIVSTVLFCISILCSLIFIAVKAHLAVVLPITLTFFAAAVAVFAYSMYLTLKYKNTIVLKNDKGTDTSKR